MTSTGWHGFGGYLRVLHAPTTPRVVAAMFVGRLPNGMFPLGIVFVLRQYSGSYSAAGVALAALMLGTTCSAPFRGRAVDRWGQSRILIPLVLAQAATIDPAGGRDGRDELNTRRIDAADMADAGAIGA